MAAVAVNRPSIRDALIQALAPSKVVVSGADSACGGGLRMFVLVVSEKFQDISLVDRHRMVQAALEKQMPGIHALTIKAWTYDQYVARKDKLEPMAVEETLIWSKEKESDASK